MKQIKPIPLLLFCLLFSCLFFLNRYLCPTSFFDDSFSYITLQYRHSCVEITNKDELATFHDIFQPSNFRFDGSDFGKKGWIYCIKGYDKSNRLVADFTITSESTITYNGWCYRVKKTNIPLKLLSNYFK